VNKQQSEAHRFSEADQPLPRRFGRLDEYRSDTRDEAVDIRVEISAALDLCRIVVRKRT
jgi:hypothetical protein